MQDDPAFPMWLRGYPAQDLKFVKEGKVWLRPTSMPTLKAAIDKCQREGSSFKLTGGNQLVVLPWLEHDRYEVFIETSGISELHLTSWSADGLTFGAATTIRTLRDLLQSGVLATRRLNEKKLKAESGMRTKGKSAWKKVSIVE